MPFTLSHPALVLPLNFLPRNWISITGLVIGSMAPDLQAFFTDDADKSQTHTWWGILYFCIPVSLVLGGISLWAFFWAANSGQFDDLDTPALHVLTDDDPPGRVNAAGDEEPKP